MSTGVEPGCPRDDACDQVIGRLRGAKEEARAGAKLVDELAQIPEHRSGLAQ